MGSKRSKSDYLSVSGQFVTYVTLWIVYSLKRGSDGEDGHVGTHSSTDPDNIGQIWKIISMYNCVICMCICIIVSLMV